ATQRWNPAWIIAMESIGQVDKANAVAPVAERGHRNTATFRQLPLGRGTGMRSVRRAGGGPGHARAIRQHRNEDAASLKMRNSGRTYIIPALGRIKKRDCEKWLVPSPSWPGE